MDRRSKGTKKTAEPDLKMEGGSFLFHPMDSLQGWIKP